MQYKKRESLGTTDLSAQQTKLVPFSSTKDPSTQGFCSPSFYLFFYFLDEKNQSARHFLEKGTSATLVQLLHYFGPINFNRNTPIFCVDCQALAPAGILTTSDSSLLSAGYSQQSVNKGSDNKRQNKIYSPPPPHNTEVVQAWAKS